MSTCENPSGGDPNNLFHYDDEEDPSEPEFSPDGDNDHIQPDPLLKSGTFIVEPTGPALTTEQQQPAQNGGAADRASDREPEQFASPPPPPPPKSTVERVTASPLSAAAEAKSTPSSSRKGQKTQAGASGGAGPIPDRPGWLPEGWGFECKVRTSGATAGSFDRYYIEPASGRRFRSKVEVDYFLQTGSKPNKKQKADADPNHQEKSGSKKKKSAPLNFDVNDLPEQVRWVLTDADKDQWTPFVGDRIVPKSTRQEWTAAFKFYF